MFDIKGSSAVTINGLTYEGNSIQIKSDGTIVIDGQVGGEVKQYIIEVTVIGDVNTLSTLSGDISVTGDVVDVTTTSGDVDCKEVKGDVETVSGDVKCTKVHGKISTVSGDINKRFW